MVGTAIRQFNDQAGIIQDIACSAHPDKWTLHGSVPFHHPTIMTYKSVYDTLGGYTVTERTLRCEDYDLWFRFFAAGFCGANISEPLYLFRENMSAIRRRTFKSRWNAYQTAKIGYKMLGYPKRWLIREFLITLLKSITPTKVQYAYRLYQQRKANKKC